MKCTAAQIVVDKTVSLSKQWYRKGKHSKSHRENCPSAVIKVVCQALWGQDRADEAGLPETVVIDNR
jgi:hypothetical protein